MATFNHRLSNLLAWVSFFWAIFAIILSYDFIGFEFSFNFIFGYLIFLLPSIILSFINYLICGSLRIFPWMKVDND